MKLGLFYLLIWSQTAMALSPDQIGSDGFFTMTENTLPWSDSVRFARDPHQASNLIFSDQEMIKALADPESDYVFGMGSKEYITEAVNLSGNMTMAAAKTDPRNINYIDKSLVSSIEALSSEEQGNMAQLDKMQLGDSTRRFIEGQAIEPNIGSLQTADNEQAFQSTYDNILLGRAEQALYEGDRIDATTHFDGKASEFEESSDKQALAADYQRDGILRSKKTAETFRDFFGHKSDVTSQNLSRMPTVPSLLQNCQANTKPSEDLLGAYNVAISDDERSFYDITPPSYGNVNFCESYIQMEQSSLIQNLPVHEKLAAINEDSLQMAAGLDDVAQKLGQQGLSAAELSQVLANSSAWNQLKERQAAWSECAEKDCLSVLEAKVKKVVDYPGADADLSIERRQMRENLAQVIATKRLVSSISGSGAGRDYQSMANVRAGPNYSGNTLGLGGGIGTGSESVLEANSKRLQALKARGAIGEESAMAEGLALSNLNVNYQQGASRGGSLVFKRDENGVLLGPSGKPVMGHENPAHLDIFQIISSRYQKKFFVEK